MCLPTPAPLNHASGCNKLDDIHINAAAAAAQAHAPCHAGVCRRSGRSSLRAAGHGTSSLCLPPVARDGRYLSTEGGSCQRREVHINSCINACVGSTRLPFACPLEPQRKARPPCQHANASGLHTSLSVCTHEKTGWAGYAALTTHATLCARSNWKNWGASARAVRCQCLAHKLPWEWHVFKGVEKMHRANAAHAIAAWLWLQVNTPPRSQSSHAASQMHA